MKKLRVGLLILSNSWGGAEESVYNLAKNLNKKDFDVNLFINEFLYKRYYPLAGVNVVNLGQLESNKKLKKIYTILKIRLKLIEYIKKFRIELVHAHLENSILLLGTTLGGLNMPTIFTLRGDETRIYHRPKKLEQKIIRSILNKMFKDKNTTVTTISTWLIKDFKDERKSQIVVTPNGVDCKKFRPLNLKSQKNTILYVGRFVEGKGIEDLVEVARELNQYEFIFVGKGPMSELINLPNTRDLGFKKREQLVKLYNKATICVYPSHYEAFGLAALEAMASGRAIIASNLGFREYVESGKDGTLVAPGNIRQLKETIVTFMENRGLREKMETNARRKALEYDLTKTVLRYQDLYKKVVAK